jgi:Flp pilus assembly protein TadD
VWWQELSSFVETGLGPVRREVMRAIYASPFFTGKSDNFEKEAGSHVAAYDLYLDQLSEWEFGPSDLTVVVSILTANAWAEELIDLADHRAIQGKLEFATGVYRRALEISPQDPNIHYGLGILYGRQGAWETAERHFARATKLVPTWVSPWLRLSVALRKLGKDDEVKKAMARAHALDKKGDEIRRQFVIANILEEDGRVEEAVEVYRRILADDPQSSRGWWLLGKALNQGGRSSEAKAAHERAVELSPYWAAPHFGLAESLEALDDLEGAEKAGEGCKAST